MAFQPSVASALALIVTFLSMNPSSDAGYCRSSYVHSTSQYGVKKTYYSCGFWNWKRCTSYKGYYYRRYQRIYYKYCCQGWSGSSCRIPVCSEGCGNGRCTEPDVCKCYHGWQGNRCNEPICKPRCTNGGHCASPGHCRCPPVWTGLTCSRPVCQQRCAHGTCIAPQKCQCDAGWTGVRCDQPVCDHECSNRGRCVSPNMCTCISGWIDANCSKAACSQGCDNGICITPESCSCSTGWTGRSCGIAVCNDSCVNGQCTKPNVCKCFRGWQGPRCDEAICQPRCANGGHCVSPGLCRCPSTWTGLNCSIPVCQQRCAHGTCSAPQKCHCDTGWSGFRCDQPVCEHECNHRGTCVRPSVCTCTHGWAGANCSKPVCNQGCGNGICISPGSCWCNTGWTGRRCDIAVCNDLCVNGQCIKPNQCHCKVGWTGNTCAKGICPMGCLHGECIEPSVCRCEDGWEGDACSEPVCGLGCGEHGVCVYPDACICHYGYYGDSCDKAICDVPCQNGGTCSAPRICTCTEQFTGKYCENQVCGNIDPPANGAVFCATFNDRRSCTFSCKNGYGFAVYAKDWNPTFCVNSTTWSHERILNTTTVPDCTNISGLFYIFGHNSGFNYTGNCHDMARNDKIHFQEMFTGAVKKHGFVNCAEGVCDNALVNENLACSQTSKRATHITATRDIKLHVKVDVGLTLPKEVTLKPICDHDCRVQLRKVLAAGKTVVNNLKMDLETSPKWNNIATSDGNVLSFVKGSSRAIDPRADCNEKGQIRSEMKCLSCPKGTFVKSNRCEFCPLGTYQDQQTQTGCIACPSGLTTAKVGATTLSQCRAKCKAGHYSHDGLEPSTPCPKDHYQHYVGWKYCFRCPENTFTVSEGTVRKIDCLSDCSAACRGRFLCDNCTCIDNSKVCDGVTDCFDISDETDCFDCDSESCVGREMNTKTVDNSAFVISMLVTKVKYRKSSGVVNFIVFDILRSAPDFNIDLLHKGVMYLTPKVVTCKCVKLHPSQTYLVAGYYNGNRLILTDKSAVTDWNILNIPGWY